MQADCFGGTQGDDIDIIDDVCLRDNKHNVIQIPVFTVETVCAFGRPVTFNSEVRRNNRQVLDSLSGTDR